jgi:hypothetical protein
MKKSKSIGPTPEQCTPQQLAAAFAAFDAIDRLVRKYMQRPGQTACTDHPAKVAHA